MIRQQGTNSKGFTLIEVVIALAILGWVMGSAFFAVKQYADQRFAMRERFYSGQVAWNQLMEEYRVSRGMASSLEVRSRDTQGEVLNGQQYWLWSVEDTQAAGEELFQYRVVVSLEEDGNPSSSRTMYLVRGAGQQ